jgi:hypothetical protein
MVPAHEQWIAISKKVLHTTGSIYDRNGPTCCNKWNTLNDEFKKVHDYMTAIGTGCTYWDLSPHEREEYRLPKCFNKEHYDLMHSFLSERPIHNPPNQRDTQNPGNDEYTSRTLEEILGMAQAEDDEPTFEEDDPITQHCPASMEPHNTWARVEEVGAPGLTSCSGPSAFKSVRPEVIS